MKTEHGPGCLEAQIEDDLTSMCRECRADRISQEYHAAIEEEDPKLLEAVWAAADTDDLLRQKVELESHAAVTQKDWGGDWDVPKEILRDVEARHEFIKDKLT